LYFATAIVLGGYASGVLVESHVGRPTKIEGNPQHPASLGATDALTQASILTLYDPDRSQVVRHVDEIVPWAQFDEALTTRSEALAAGKGEGLRILTGTVTSPTLGRQLRALLAAYPQARWHQYEPIGSDGARGGAKLAFGDAVDAQYAFDKAKVIVSLDA